MWRYPTKTTDTCWLQRSPRKPPRSRYKAHRRRRPRHPLTRTHQAALTCGGPESWSGPRLEQCVLLLNEVLQFRPVHAGLLCHVHHDHQVAADADGQRGNVAVLIALSIDAVGRVRHAGDRLAAERLVRELESGRIRGRIELQQAY